MDTDRLLTYRETADRLGVCVRTVYAYVAAGELPTVRLGRLRRVHPDDLTRFIAARRTDAGEGRDDG